MNSKCDIKIISDKGRLISEFREITIIQVYILLTLIKPLIAIYKLPVIIEIK